MATLDRQFTRPTVTPLFVYEEIVRARADRRGWESSLEGDYVRVTDGERSVRHRVRGSDRVAYAARVQQSLVRGDKP